MQVMTLVSGVRESVETLPGLYRRSGHGVEVTILRVPVEEKVYKVIVAHREYGVNQFDFVQPAEIETESLLFTHIITKLELYWIELAVDQLRFIKKAGMYVH